MAGSCVSLCVSVQHWQRVTLDCHFRTVAQKQCTVWFLEPDSTMSLLLDALGLAVSDMTLRRTHMWTAGTLRVSVHGQGLAWKQLDAGFVRFRKHVAYWNMYSMQGNKTKVRLQTHPNSYMMPSLHPDKWYLKASCCAIMQKSQHQCLSYTQRVQIPHYSGMRVLRP